MKKKSLYLALMVVFLITGCTSYKNVPYIQNSRVVSESTKAELYDAKIMPKDILTITVNCPDNPEAATIFNLTVPSDMNSTYNRRNLTSQPVLQTYLVSNDGIINFPILGEIKVLGMTNTELEKYISSKLYGTYLKQEPIVTVTMSNFKIAVTGEVASPGVYTISNGKVNIFEALALAKDMTVWGRRDNVKLIRENEVGKTQIIELDLNDANIINSPYYQLQQNDILYVTPNKTKSKNSGIGSETSLWFSATSILVSLASLSFNNRICCFISSSSKLS